MDDAQRQQQYRNRKREAAYAAWADSDRREVAQHSTSAVLDALMMAMQQADDTSKSEAARSMAGMSVVDLAQELARRYARPNRDSNET